MLAFFCLCPILMQNSLAQSTTVNDSKALKVFSWNIYMLPGMTKFSKEIGRIHQGKRADAIAEYVNQQNFDIIVWQEIFHGKARRKIRRKLKKLYPYQYGPANNGRFSFKISSGLSFFSKVPLSNKQTIKFEDCIGSDCFARKGAILMQGQWEGQDFQILGTHLQAAGGCDLRLKQAREIRDKLLIPNQKSGVPQLICGDMNIPQKWDSYKEMLDIYSVDGYQYPPEVKATNTGTEPYIIDYIFVKPNDTEITDVQRSMLIPRHSWAEGKEWLSDHHAIFMKIIF